MTKFQTNHNYQLTMTKKEKEDKVPLGIKMKLNLYIPRMMNL
ncbi:MAG: hypothetical protein ACE5WD_06995 [Candidatus Aminicenantia bacterium]